MGYTTDFNGEITIDPPLNPSELAFLNDFSGSRRMCRKNGPLYAVPGDNYGQNQTDDVLDYSEPDPDQPGLWCQWISPDGTTIEWDGGEKFYNSEKWMKYLITHLFTPDAREYVKDHLDEHPMLAEFTFDHIFNGTISAQGEDPDDKWALYVEDNIVSVADAVLTYGPRVKL